MAQRAGQINIIQILRAYAALPVVLFHTGYTMSGIHPFGNFGVDVFFVLSGYLMALICATDTHAFLRRRIIRIVPSYWLMTILLYAVAAVFPRWMKATQAVPVELLKSLLFVPFMKSNGLFQPILFVGWSINYEMLFYLVMALSIFIWKRRPVLTVTVILISLMSVSSLFAERSPIAKFYSNPVIFEFIFGLFVYSAVHAVRSDLLARMRYLAAGIMALSLVSLPLVEAFSIFPSLSRVIQFGFLSVLLVGSACLLAQSGVDPRFRLAILVGDASYTLYLVHPYVEMVLDRILANYIPLLHTTTTFGCILGVVLAVAVSILLYLKLEKPTYTFLTKRFCRRNTAPAPVYTNPLPHYAGRRTSD